MDPNELVLQALEQAKAMHPSVGMPAQPPSTGSTLKDWLLHSLTYGGQGFKAGPSVGTGMPPGRTMMPGGVGITPKPAGQMLQGAPPPEGITTPMSNMNAATPPTMGSNTDMFSAARAAMARPLDPVAPSPDQLMGMKNSIPPNPFERDNPNLLSRRGMPTISPVQDSYFEGGLRPANDAGPLNIHNNPEGMTPGNKQINDYILKHLGSEAGGPQKSAYDIAVEKQIRDQELSKSVSNKTGMTMDELIKLLNPEPPTQ